MEAVIDRVGVGGGVTVAERENDIDVLQVVEVVTVRDSVVDDVCVTEVVTVVVNDDVWDSVNTTEGVPVSLKVCVIDCVLVSTIVWVGENESLLVGKSDALEVGSSLRLALTVFVSGGVNDRVVESVGSDVRDPVRDAVSVTE